MATHEHDWHESDVCATCGDERVITLAETTRTPEGTFVTEASDLGFVAGKGYPKQLTVKTPDGYQIVLDGTVKNMHGEFAGVQYNGQHPDGKSVRLTVFND